MDCKCGGYAKRSFENFSDARTAESALGKPVTALPCVVIRDHCLACGIDARTVWYPADSVSCIVPEKPKAKSLMGLFNRT